MNQLVELQSYLEILRNARKMVSHVNQAGMKEYFDDLWFRQELQVAGILDTCIQNLNKKIIRLEKNDEKIKSTQ